MARRARRIRRRQIICSRTLSFGLITASLSDAERKLR